MFDIRTINVEELKSRTIKPMISFRADQTPALDIIAELIEDEENFLVVSNPYVLLPVQSQGSDEVRLWPRPWCMTQGKDQKIVLSKSGILTYFELLDKNLINLYISNTSEVQIISPDQMPKPDSGVINLFRK